jgi:arginine:pyruvate transaminase
VASHPDVTSRLVLVAEAMLFGSQPFIEDALTIALNEKHPEVQRLRLAFRERAETVINAFEGSASVTARMPEGGMFIMLDVRKTKLTGEEFAWQLLNEHNVCVMPGESFGNGGAGHIRIALTVDAEVLRIACFRIRKLADHLCAETN